MLSMLNFNWLCKSLSLFPSAVQLFRSCKPKVGCFSSSEETNSPKRDKYYGSLCWQYTQIVQNRTHASCNPNFKTLALTDRTLRSCVQNYGHASNICVVFSGCNGGADTGYTLVKARNLARMVVTMVFVRQWTGLPNFAVLRPHVHADTAVR